MAHTTSLKFHLKQRHIWFDVLILIGLYVLASYYPLLKIIPLIATLELFSFFAYHLLSHRVQTNLQGFLGGLVSSTAVFIQVLNDKKFKGESELTLIGMLAFAMIAMLLESVFLLITLASHLSLIYYLPFVVQIACFGIATIAIQRWVPAQKGYVKGAASELKQLEILKDHPIEWLSVFKLALMVLGLILLIHFITSELTLAPDFATMLAALFEAHAVLAAILLDAPQDGSATELVYLFLMILTGNTISKSYLLLRAKNIRRKFLPLSYLIFALACAFASTWFIW